MYITLIHHMYITLTHYMYITIIHHMHILILFVQFDKDYSSPLTNVREHGTVIDIILNIEIEILD